MQYIVCPIIYSVNNRLYIVLTHLQGLYVPPIIENVAEIRLDTQTSTTHLYCRYCCATCTYWWMICNICDFFLCGEKMLLVHYFPSNSHNWRVEFQCLFIYETGYITFFSVVCLVRWWWCRFSAFGHGLRQLLLIKLPSGICTDENVLIFSFQKKTCLFPVDITCIKVYNCQPYTMWTNVLGHAS